MTASEFIKSKFPNFWLSKELTENEMIELIKEFALLKCAEQREICNDNAFGEFQGATGDEWYSKNDVQIFGIINSPNPKM